MCLTKIDNSNLEQFRNGKGYKVYHLHNKKLYSIFKTLEGASIIFGQEECIKPLPLHTEFTAKSRKIASQLTGDYDAGFHIFVDEKQARIYMEELGFCLNFVIVEVEYKNAHTMGIDQFDTLVVVAQKMTIKKILS